MKNFVKQGAICSLILSFFITNTISGFTSKTDSLDIKKYLSLADKENIYPSSQQIKMLEEFVPYNLYKPAPNINNRIYWNKIALLESGQDYIIKANNLIHKQPEIPISDEIYRRANKEGNRRIYKPRYYRTMETLEVFIVAECIENKGRFISQIKIYMQAIMDMKSWLHPNHDDNENSNLEGKSITIDLGARKFGTDLTLAIGLLSDKLPKAFKNQASALVKKRITDSYLASCKGENKLNKWIRSTSNWNSVCNSGTIFSTIANSQNRHERLVAIGCMLNSSVYYLSGFGNDGYCSEGIGYWSYGFGHYLYMAQIILDYTDGKINLFEFSDEEKLKKVGDFPENFEIQNSNFAPFADGNITATNKEGNFAYAISSYYYGALKAENFIFKEVSEQLIAWNHPGMFITSDIDLQKELPGVTYFNTSGMVISRGKQKTPFSIAVKAGHNAENHNHSDVGTYTLLLGKDFISGDIGAPSYVAGAFSPDNKARSSWGHPVPIINNQLQSNGRSFRGTILETDFKEHKDKVVLDLKSAYEIPHLKLLERTVINDKSGNGEITIKDEFISSKKVVFGTTIMTYSDFEIIDSNTIILTSVNEHLKLKVLIESSDGEITINPEPVPVKALRNGKNAVRIGLDFKNKISQGSIQIRFIPYSE